MISSWKLKMVLAVVAAFAIGVGFDRLWLSPADAGTKIIPLQDRGRVLGLRQSPRTPKQDVDFKQFWELWDLLKNKYYEQPVSDKRLFYGAMSGLASSLGDPYTAYFEPKLAEEFQQSLSGKFEGIGAEIGLKNEQLQIVAPLPDTPAERAGILAGDYIIKINDEETTGMSVEKAVTLIRGPRGSSVRLTLLRPAAKQPPFEVTIVRDEIKIKSVKWKMLPSNIALIEVTHFNSDTKAQFSAAVQNVLQKEPKGLVLDLRNNPGGFLDVALAMAGEWVGDQVVVKERKQGKIIDQLRGVGQARLKGVKTVVLVNQGSASASEIVAGALQDYRLGTIVGVKTFGKGSVQDYQTLRDGSGVKITIAEWLTPYERTIHKTGLEPDVVIDRTLQDYEAQRDPQLDRAVAILTGQALPATSSSTSAASPSRP